MILAYAPDLIENAYAEALIAGKAYVAGNCPVILPKANRKAVRPSGTAISGFSASAISSSASSTRLRTSAPSRPDTTIGDKFPRRSSTGLAHRERLETTVVEAHPLYCHSAGLDRHQDLLLRRRAHPSHRTQRQRAPAASGPGQNPPEVERIKRAGWRLWCLETIFAGAPPCQPARGRRWTRNQLRMPSRR
jgi:hypothetical protein